MDQFAILIRPTLIIKNVRSLCSNPSHCKNVAVPYVSFEQVLVEKGPTVNLSKNGSCNRRWCYKKNVKKIDVSGTGEAIIAVHLIDHLANCDCREISAREYREESCTIIFNNHSHQKSKFRGQRSKITHRRLSWAGKRRVRWAREEARRLRTLSGNNIHWILVSSTS